MDHRYYGGQNSGGGNGSNDPGPIPERWLMCPRIANSFIANRFLAFKTPLSARFTPQMSPEHHFQPDMVFDYMKVNKVRYPNLLMLQRNSTFLFSLFTCAAFHFFFLSEHKYIRSAKCQNSKFESIL